MSSTTTPPYVAATLQSAAIAAFANLIAQTIEARNKQIPLYIDWVPVFHFVLYAFISTPPNFMAQDLLETSFPSHATAPSATPSLSEKPHGDDKAQDVDEKRRATASSPPSSSAPAPRLDIRNTVVKTVLDQTVVSAANQLLYCVFINSVRAAMAPGSGGVAALRWERDVWAPTRADFWPLMQASWAFWPFVSIVNFTLLRTVEMRNLFGSLAGVAWGVYLSMFT